MVSWRWGLDCQCVELGVYYHVDGERLIVPHGAGEVWATVRPGEIVHTRLEIREKAGADGRDQVWVKIQTPSDSTCHQQSFDIDLNRNSRVINPWHGGNRAALHDMVIRRKWMD